MTTTPEAVEAAKKFADKVHAARIATENETRSSYYDYRDACHSLFPYALQCEDVHSACIRILAARVRELERDREGLVDVINRVLASATPSQKEHPTMFAAWAACQAVLMDKPQHPQPEQAKEVDEVLYGLEGQELLDDDLDDIVSRILENYSQRPKESFEVLADRIPWPVKVFEFRRVKVSETAKNSLAESTLESVIEQLNEDYSGPDGVSTNPTAPMQLAARRFVDEVVQHYKVWNCEPTGEVIQITREQAKEIVG